jgi:hypothetical protein
MTSSSPVRGFRRTSITPGAKQAWNLRACRGGIGSRMIMCGRRRYEAVAGMDHSVKCRLGSHAMGVSDAPTGDHFACMSPVPLQACNVASISCPRITPHFLSQYSWKKAGGQKNDNGSSTWPGRNLAKRMSPLAGLGGFLASRVTCSPSGLKIKSREYTKTKCNSLVRLSIRGMIRDRTI